MNFEPAKRLARGGSISEKQLDALIVIDFDRPARRVGFLLESADTRISATIRGFAEDGTELGAHPEDGWDQCGEVFTGVETDDPRGISKLTIDYGSETVAEQLRDLIVEFDVKPTFSVFVPHIADGPTPAGRLRTSITITAVAGTTQGPALFFFDSSGRPLKVELDDGTAASELEVDLGRRSATLVTRGSPDQLVSGWRMQGWAESGDSLVTVGGPGKPASRDDIGGHLTGWADVPPGRPCIFYMRKTDVQSVEAYDSSKATLVWSAHSASVRDWHICRHRHSRATRTYLMGYVRTCSSGPFPSCSRSSDPLFP